MARCDVEIQKQANATEHHALINGEGNMKTWKGDQGDRIRRGGSHRKAHRGRVGARMNGKTSRCSNPAFPREREKEISPISREYVEHEVYTMLSEGPSPPLSPLFSYLVSYSLNSLSRSLSSWVHRNFAN